jgi:hypothetical protein
LESLLNRELQLESWIYYCGMIVEFSYFRYLDLLIGSYSWIEEFHSPFEIYFWNRGVVWIRITFVGFTVELRNFFWNFGFIVLNEEFHFGFIAGILGLQLRIWSYFLHFGFTVLLGNYCWNYGVSVGISYFRFFGINIGIWSYFSHFGFIGELGSCFHHCRVTFVILEILLGLSHFRHSGVTIELLSTFWIYCWIEELLFESWNYCYELC